MLKRLRRKFIVIVMVLVGTVLVGVLGSTYVATWQTQRQLIDDTLTRSVNGGMHSRISFGGARPNAEGRAGAMLSLLVDVNDDGIVLEVSDAPVIVNMTVLQDVIGRVFKKGEVSGYDHDEHLAWKSMELDSGGRRIALVDTTSSDTILREQAIKDIQIICIALIALFAISWWLSDWALRPVEAAWEQQRRFVADASHELKTPLAVILANTQILQACNEVGEDAMRWVDSTADEAQHMKSLVGDLLQLARADESVSGGASNAMRKVDINLSEMVESAALEFDAVAFERGCMLETKVAEGIHIEGDPDWMDRLIRILIDNACKYGAVGTTIDVSLSRAANHATLAVHNLGNPIDPEDLPHVFERFYRSDKARARGDEGGFGLGLAIAKGIADAHGGSISVTSNQQSGTTFTVVL